MQWPRVAFTFMLIMALVPAALTATPSNVLGQGYVTITTQTTTTGLYTSAATTSYGTTVLTTTSAYLLGPVDIPPYFSGTAKHCAWVYLTFQAPDSQSISASFTSQYPISFYLMPDADFKLWTLGGQSVASGQVSPCWGPPAGTLIGVDGMRSYSQNLVLPAYTGASIGNRLYRLVFIQFGSTSNVSVNFELLNLPPIVFTSTVSSVAYTTAPTTELLALTTTVSQAGLPFGNLGLLAAVVAVSVIAGVLAITRRRKPSVAATLIQEAPATVHEPPRELVVPKPVTPTKPTPPQPVISEIPPIISTGYVDLDKALSGGIPEEFAVVIVSPSFDERDLLLRKVVNSALSSGRLAILISNDIGRTKDMASRYPNGFYAISPQADRITPHGANLLKIPSLENLSDANISLGLVLKDVLAKEKATKRIIIIDLLSDLLLRYKSVTTRRWLTDFVGKRKAEGFTVIATLNPLTTTKEETENIIDFFDGVIEIFEKPLTERSRRFLVIKKMYGQKYSDSEVLMDRDKLF